MQSGLRSLAKALRVRDAGENECFAGLVRVDRDTRFELFGNGYFRARDEVRVSR